MLSFTHLLKFEFLQGGLLKLSRKDSIVGIESWLCILAPPERNTVSAILSRALAPCLEQENQIRSFPFLSRLFLRLKGVCWIKYIGSFSDSELRASIRFSLALNKSGEKLFYLETEAMRPSFHKEVVLTSFDSVLSLFKTLSTDE